nr:hypothetical protein [Mesorhizobium silamurunense]
MALTNVDRQADPGTAETGYGPQPQPAIFQLFANTIDAKCVDIEFHAIVCGLCQGFLETSRASVSGSGHRSPTGQGRACRDAVGRHGVTG